MNYGKGTFLVIIRDRDNYTFHELVRTGLPGNKKLAVRQAISQLASWSSGGYDFPLSQ